MAFTELQKNLLMLVSLTLSLCSGLTFSSQQRCYSDGVKFNHPFGQTLQMFIGECMCYLVFMWYKRRFHDDYEAERVVSLASGATDKINILYFAIPAFCDFITSTISFFSMNMMPLSMQYMFNGGNIIMTAIFSIVFLKRKLHRQNYLGMFLNILGLCFMGVMALVVDNTEDDNHTTQQIMIAIILTVSSFFTYATQMVVEEKFFSKFFLHPFQAVGYEGLWGTIYVSIGIFVFSHINNPSSFEPTNNGMIEDFPNYIQEVFSFDNPAIFVLFFVSIFVILLLNGVGQGVTKYVSSLARAILGVTSPFLLWLACLVIGWETFKYYQLIAYIIITFGTLIYNEILVIPVLGFNKNLRKHAAAAALAKEEEQQLLSGPPKQNLSRRSHRSFKSLHQFNDEPLSLSEDD